METAMQQVVRAIKDTKNPLRMKVGGMNEGCGFVSVTKRALIEHVEFYGHEHIIIEEGDFLTFVWARPEEGQADEA